MVDAQTLQTASIIIASAGIFVAAIYYILQLRHQAKARQDIVKTRHADLLMRLYSTYGSNEFQEALWKVYNLEFEDYNGYVKKYGSAVSVTPASRAIWTVCWFFNGMGLLLHNKIADIDQIDDLFGYAVIWMWEMVKPIIIEGYRPQPKMQRAMQWFEFLYSEMKKREQQLAKAK